MKFLFLFLAACTASFSGQAVQPNPIANPAEVLHTSEPVTIITGDIDLTAPRAVGGAFYSSPVHSNRVPLINRATFTVVSKDRLRFHVQVDHKWDEFADLTKWKVVLTDDRGRVWYPESVEHNRVVMRTQMWDREQQQAICGTDNRGTPLVNARGDCLSPSRGQYQSDPTSGWQRRQTLGTVSVYRGKADFVFYQRDMFDANIKWLKLQIKHAELTFNFKWKFEDPQ